MDYVLFAWFSADEGGCGVSKAENYRSNRNKELIGHFKDEEGLMMLLLKYDPDCGDAFMKSMCDSFEELKREEEDSY